MHRLARPMAMLTSCVVALTLAMSGASASGGNQGSAEKRAALTRRVLPIVPGSSRAGAPVRLSDARPASVVGAAQLAYSSYWGGGGAEGCVPTIGADGSIYVACGTDSPNLPRIGGVQSYQGEEDAYIAKLDPTGRHIVYATYLGSPGQDEIDAAAVDKNGTSLSVASPGTGSPRPPERWTARSTVPRTAAAVCWATRSSPS